MNDGGLPLYLFAQTVGGTASLTTTNSMEWAQRKKMTEKIRSRLHVIISMSRRSIEAYSSQFYDLFHYGFLLNMDHWSRSEMTSYTTTALTLYCEFPKEQVRFI